MEEGWEGKDWGGGGPAVQGNEAVSDRVSQGGRGLKRASEGFPQGEQDHYLSSC